MSPSWTCRVVPRGGRLLDLAELEQTVRKVGQQFSLRGVEATAEGTLSRAPDGAPVLQLGGAEVLRLGPLRRKVQWDPEARRAAPLTAAERGAYGRLVAALGGAPRRVQLVGPLDAPPAEAPAAAQPQGSYLLEVRQFRWLP